MLYSEDDYLEIYKVVESEVHHGLKAMVLHYAINKIPLNEKDIRPLNLTPEFWNFELHNLITIGILTLGRLFDESNCRYNIIILYKSLGLNINAFSFESLKKRKGDIFADGSFEEYISGEKEFDRIMYKKIKDRIVELKKTYDTKFKIYRNKVIAHREVNRVGELDVEGFSYKELLELYIQLYNICKELWERYNNGRGAVFLSFDSITNMINNVEYVPNGSPFFKRIIKEYKLLFELLKGKMMNELLG